MTRLRTHTLPMLLLFVLLTYMVFGISFTGVVALADLQPLTMGIFLLAAVFVGVQHLRGKWRVYQTPFAGMFALWGLAFVISIIGNPDYARTSIEALWFMGLFMGLMSLFISALTNGALTRTVIEEALLLFGFVMLVIGTIQIVLLYQNMGTIPRLSNLLGNPNFYAMLLLIVAMLALHRAVVTRSLVIRLAMAAYTLLALVHLWFTGSRGGQLGFMLAVMVYIGLRLITRNAPDEATPFERINRWIRKRTGLPPVIWLGLPLLIGGVAALLIISRAGLSNRVDIYTLAWQLFTEKPLTGQGLFSYGQHMMAGFSAPPVGLYWHAHSILFEVLSELGLPGLVALVYSIVVGLRAIWQNRRVLSGRDLSAYDAPLAALVGLSLHHMVDMSMLFVTLLVLLVVVIIVTPFNPIPVKQEGRRWAYRLAQPLLWGALIIGFAWHTSIYTPYSQLLNDVRLQEAQTTVDYPAAMARLETIIAADPQNVAYRIQYANWAGLHAAETDDPADIEAAITAHEAMLAHVPAYAIGWSNLASLHWQAGDMEAAQVAVDHGITYATDWPVIHWQYAAYYDIRRLPWPISGVQWVHATPSVQLVYMRDVVSPMFLPQTVESIILPLDDVAAAFLNGLLSRTAIDPQD